MELFLFACDGIIGQSYFIVAGISSYLIVYGIENYAYEVFLFIEFSFIIY